MENIIPYLLSNYHDYSYHAFPCCGDELEVKHSNDLNKMVCEGHMKFLPLNHHFSPLTRVK
jgi:hypothetical protein